MIEQEFFPQRPSAAPSIYAFRLNDVASHNGYIKVGYTDRDVKTRIREIMHTSGVPYTILWSDSAMRPDGSCFTDHDVHAILRRNGFHRLYEGEDDNEWYGCSVDDVKAAVRELRTGEIADTQRTLDFRMRPEQHIAVKRTMEYFRKAKADEPERAPKFLWNAKMRFGKTFAAYQLCRKMGFKRILVLTFKPAVESAWHEDLVTHVDFEGWQFISNKDAHNNKIDMDTAYGILRFCISVIGFIVVWILFILLLYILVYIIKLVVGFPSELVYTVSGNRRKCKELMEAHNDFSYKNYFQASLPSDDAYKIITDISFLPAIASLLLFNYIIPIIMAAHIFSIN